MRVTPLLLGLCVFLCIPVLLHAEPPTQPNILFVFTDDHAPHAISAYGSKINQTPNIDRLAKEGMLFQNCFCTNGICAPSRAVILTGKHSHLNGVIDNSVSFDGKQQTFPKLMQQAGYQTALLGKWHLKSDPTGFDHWKILQGQGTYYNPVLLSSKGREKIEGYTTNILTDLALDWLDKGRDKQKPFVLMYQHKAPHRAWEPGPDHLTLYDDKDIPEPATLFDDWSGRTSAAKNQEMTIAKHLTDRDLKLVEPPNLTAEQLKVWKAAYDPRNEAFRKAPPTGKDLVKWKYQRYIKDYLRCIASVDDNLGKVLKYLDENGLAKNTIVIYSSDQGFFLGDNGWFDKRWMYDVSLRMPLIVRWPGVTKAGSVNSDLVQNLDFAPTFLQAAGIKTPPDMQGHSLVPLLKGDTPQEWRKSIYYHYFEYPADHRVDKHYGVRTKTHKLIYYYRIDEWELFDLEKDPTERKSVYSNPAYASIVKELKTELDRLRKLYQADDFKEAKPKPKQQSAAPKPERKPNLIFILADDLGYGDLGCYGQKNIQTPHLDQMAKDGLRFTQFYAGSTVCAPSRCALMQGLHTGHCRIRGNTREDLTPDDVIIPKILKQAGYTTGLMGKWGLGTEGKAGVPNKQGFDRFYGYLDQLHAHNYYPTYLYSDDKRVLLKNEVPQAGPMGEGVATRQVEYSHDVIVQEALDFVDANKDQPFFLYLAVTIPHANNEAKNKGMEVPDLGIYKNKEWPAPVKAHAAMISRLDADVGKLLVRLKKHGLDDNTLVLFSSDNGPHKEGGHDPDFNDSNGPLRGIKRDLYEGGIRVPLLARWPGKVPAGKTTAHQGAFWDLLPTLAAFAGASDKVPKNCDGLSFVPTLLGQSEQQKSHEALYWEFYERGGARAVRMGDWKAVQQPLNTAIQLYDLKSDLGETKDVAAAHVELVAQLRKQMDSASKPSDNYRWPQQPK